MEGWMDMNGWMVEWKDGWTWMVEWKEGQMKG